MIKSKHRRLSHTYFQSKDVLFLGRGLIGKVLVSHVDGLYTSGIIVEAESYRGPDDKACHAYNHRRTPRTEIMYAQGGHAYIYICYGIHHLFNVVTGPVDHAHAVLIRALQPLDGIDIMMKRRGMKTLQPHITRGPGALSVAMGWDSSLSGINMNEGSSIIYIEDRKIKYADDEIKAGPRIGVDGAGPEAAAYPWRFYVKGNQYVSAKRT